MHFLRNQIDLRKITILLIVSMCLRSSIAVGYMLDINSADASLFSIKICDGPAGINSIANLDNHSLHHDHNEQHEHSSKTHIFSTCSFWSTSSQLLLFDKINDTTPIKNDIDDSILYEPNFVYQLYFNHFSIRAPPILS